MFACNLAFHYFCYSFTLSSSISKSQLSIVGLIYHVSYFCTYLVVSFFFHFVSSVLNHSNCSFCAHPPKILILMWIYSSLVHWRGLLVGYNSLYPLVILMSSLDKPTHFYIRSYILAPVVYYSTLILLVCPSQFYILIGSIFFTSHDMSIFELLLGFIHWFIQSINCWYHMCETWVRSVCAECEVKFLMWKFKWYLGR